MNKISLPVFILVLIGFSSCLKTKPFSTVPAIEFVSYNISDTLNTTLNRIDKYITIKISFKDGDGDIGLSSEDTTSADFFATRNEIQNGIVVKSSDENARIPNLSSYAGKHGLNGYLEETFTFIKSVGKTVRYDVYLTDNAQHKSNVVSTPNILIK